MSDGVVPASHSSRIAGHAAWAAMAVALLAVGWPLLALLLPVVLPLIGLASDVTPSLRAQGAVNLPEGAFLGTGALLVESVLWIAAIAAMAVALGWPTGVAVAERLERGRGRRAAFALCLPLCLPAYLMFWSLWHLVEPTTWLGDRLLRWNLAVALRETTMVIGLTLWAVPLVAWCVIAARRARPDASAALRALDGDGWVGRVAAAWRHDRETLLVAWSVAALGLLGESVSFDLAQVRTYGFELRSLDLSGASTTTVLAAGWPACLVALGLIAMVMALVGRSGRRRGASRGHRGSVAPSRIVKGWGVVVIAMVMALPLALLVQIRSWHEVESFVALYARPSLTSIEIAAAAGALIGAIAVMLLLIAMRGSATQRRVAAVAVTLLALGACLPATLVAIALENGWNHAYVGPLVYDTPLIILLALVARFGIVAAVVAALAARGTDGGMRELVALDDPVSLRAVWMTLRPSLVAAGVIAGLAGAALAFSEIVVTSRLQPPRLQLLATSTLNAIHYQQPETVLLASAGAIALGALGSAAAVLLMVRRRRRGWPAVALRALPILLVASMVVGCEPPPPDGRPTPIAAERTFGTPGYGPGQFRTPRAVAFDAARGRFFVVDKEARIQRFASDGTPELEWKMPESKVGKPVGLSVHPDGRVFVADTHYNRVLVFDPEGHELARFGSYGTDRGQFIYPTDITFGNDGRIYVGEYGGHDRIQIFSRTFEVLGEFGSAGTGEGELSRPQGLEFDREHNELYVADSNNHRIVIYSPDGQRLRQFGIAGIEVGQLCYPRGIVFCGDGSIMVVEFGNHRVQRFEAQPGPRFGTSLGLWGGMCEGAADRTRGSEGTQREAPLEAGRLKYPWDMAGVPGHVMVLDSGNNRVMLAKLPS